MMQYKLLSTLFNGDIPWMIQNQFGRRNLPNFVRCELAFELEKLMTNSQGERSDLDSTSVAIGTEVIQPRDQAAKLAGVGHNTYNKSKRISESADEETKEKLHNSEISFLIYN